MKVRNLPYPFLRGQPLKTLLDYEPVISNLSHIFLLLHNDKIMLKCKKGPQDVSTLVLFLNSPCVTKKYFLLKISIYYCQANRY